MLKTIDEAIEDLMDRKRSSFYDEGDLRKLIVSMTTLPNPFGTSWSMDKDPLTVSSAWNVIISNGLLYQDHHTGWLDRSGKFYGADFAWHEKLLYWLERETHEVEREGWARLSMNGYQCAFRLSSKQYKFMRNRGIEINREEELVKPVYEETMDTNMLSM